MRSCNQSHSAYAGVDLHARTMYLHVPGADGRTRLETNLPARPRRLAGGRRPFRQGLVVGCKCMFA